MAGLCKDPRNGVLMLRKRIPARYRSVANRQGETIKITTGTADRKEALKQWPDLQRRWAEMEAGWERKLNVVSLTPQRAQELAATWAAWIAADQGRLECSEEDADLFGDPFGNQAPGHSQGPPCAGRAPKPPSARDAPVAGPCGRSGPSGRRNGLSGDARRATRSHAASGSSRLPGSEVARHRDQGHRRALDPTSGSPQGTPASSRCASPRPPSSVIGGTWDAWRSVAVIKPRTVAETKYSLDQLAAFLGHNDALKDYAGGPTTLA